MNQIRESAKNSNDKTAKIISKNLSSISDEASAEIPSTSSLSRMVQNLRSKKLDKFPINNGLCDMVIPAAYTVTNKGKNFLLHDSQEGIKRFLMFSTKNNLKFLKSCEHWHSDGTFKVVPVIFTQLYTVHGLVEGKTIPLVYFMLPNKSKKIYTKALTVLKNMVDYSPKSILTDYEAAFIKTFQKLFPTTDIKGCNFNFNECIYKHVQSCGLQTRYAEDLEFMTSVKMLAALSFVPVQDVFYAYDSLVSSDYFIENEEILNDFLNYFESTWIGEKKRNSIRGDPLFSIQMWNCFDSVIDNLPTTNNGVEGWHNRFANIVDRYHAQMNEFINSLKMEQNTTEVLIQQFRSGREIALPKRKKFKNYDSRLKNVVQRYDRQNVLEYLRDIATLVSL